MLKKLLAYILLTTLFFLAPNTLLAADLEITCFSDRSPEFVRNTDPLFQISGFTPGDSSSRTIFVRNNDPENPCRIFFRVSGSTNILTDKIEVNIPTLFTGTLSEYIGSRITMANLPPNEEITREITMKLPTDAGNLYAERKASFDIIVESEWGSDSQIDNDDDSNNDVPTGITTPAVAGVRNLFANLAGEVMGIGVQAFAELEEEEEIEEEVEEIDEDEETDEIEEEEGEILGIADKEECTERTLWWIPLLAQFIFTIIVIFLNKSFLKYKRVKLIISLILGLVSFLLIRWIGCGCNPVWLCINHWVPNSIVAISPILTYLKKTSKSLEPRI